MLFILLKKTIDFFHSVVYTTGIMLKEVGEMTRLQAIKKSENAREYGEVKIFDKRDSTISFLGFDVWSGDWTISYFDGHNRQTVICTKNRERVIELLED